MMSNKKPTFTSADLNKLVDESIAEADQFEKELQKIDETSIELSNTSEDDYLPETDKPWSDVGNLINKDTGESVSFSYVYKKIAELIDNGNASLQMLQSIDIDVADPSLISAASSLMNAIRGCISEFTRIHQQWIRFNQTMKLEDKKLANRMALAKYRNDLVNGRADAPEAKVSDLFEIKSSDLVAFLKWQKEQKELEKQKEEKI